MLDAATAQMLREIVAKGAMPPLALVVDDCRVAGSVNIHSYWNLKPLPYFVAGGVPQSLWGTEF